MISVPARVLCLVAHPDDLEPQAGGTICRLTNLGSQVHILNAAIPDYPNRREEAEKSAAIIGASSSFYRGDTELASSTEWITGIDSLVSHFNPDLVISHHEIDTHQDHVAMAQIAQTVCRRNHIALWQLSHSFPGGYLPHRPQPNLFIDITSVHTRKMEAVSSYQSQVSRYSGLFPNNWVEIIESRDRYYGGMLNQDGHSATRYAEGFVVGKMVWKE